MDWLSCAVCDAMAACWLPTAASGGVELRLEGQVAAARRVEVGAGGEARVEELLGALEGDARRLDLRPHALGRGARLLELGALRGEVRLLALAHLGAV